MASSLISNPITNSDRSRDASKRRRKKKAPAQKNHQDQIQNPARWQSPAQQQIYTSKLHQALARLNLGSGGGSSGSGGGDAPRRGKAVREAADRALAVTAKVRTRWSRAILANRLKLKFRNHKRKRVVATASRVATGSNRSRKPRVSVFRLKGKTLPAVQTKVRFLGRLVPGCRKQPFPVILEEAIDYISAVQMQIRAMTDLADRLSSSSSTSTSTLPGQSML